MLDDFADRVLDNPTSVAIAAAASGVPALTRSAGVVLEAEGLVRLPILTRRAGHLLAALQHTPCVAALFTRVDATLRSTQLKGRLLEVVPATDADRAVALAAFGRFETALESISPERDFANVIADVDVVLRVQVERVFDQTPGPGAGRLLRTIAEVRSKRTWQDAAVEDERRRVSIIDTPRAFDGSIPPVLVSVDAAGMPNVIHVSKVDVIDQRHLVLSRQFFRKTAENLLRNPRALLNLADPVSNRMFVLELRHLRVETSGPLFDRLADEIMTIAAMMGASDIFRLEAADVFEVLEQYEVSGFVQDSP